MIKELKTMDGKCFCGKKHKSEIEVLETDRNSMKKLPDYLLTKAFKKVTILYREKDKEAGNYFKKLVKKIGISVRMLMVEDAVLASDETYAGFLTIHTSGNEDAVLLLGTGYFLIFTRYILSRLNIPVILLSDNIPGYSAISALVPIYEKGIPSVKRIKEPVAVFYDPDYVMTDQLSLELAKLHTASMTLALFEWRLSSILEDNYFCAFLENQMSKNIRFVNRSLDDEHCSIKEKLNILTEFQFVISLLTTYADHEALLYGSCFMLESSLSKDINHLTEDIPSRDRLMSLSLTTRMGRHLVHMVEDRRLVDFLEFGKAKDEELKDYFGDAYHKVSKNMNASGKFQKSKIMMRRRNAENHLDDLQRIREGFFSFDYSKRGRKVHRWNVTLNEEEKADLYKAYSYAGAMNPSCNLLMLYQDFNAGERLFSQV